VPPKRRITLLAPAGVRSLVADAGGTVEALAGLDAVHDLPAVRPAGSVPLAFEGQELLLVNLVDAVDAGAERTRLEKLVADKLRLVAGFQAKLGNPGYLAKAKPELIAETRTLMDQANADIDAARRALDALR
jgi:valyl-tRNA synthetase